MIKNIIITIIVSTIIGVFGPRSLADVGAHMTRVGVLMVRLGLVLDPPRPSDDGYDAGEDDDPRPYLEEARA